MRVCRYVGVRVCGYMYVRVYGYECVGINRAANIILLLVLTKLPKIRILIQFKILRNPKTQKVI